MTRFIILVFIIISVFLLNPTTTSILGYGNGNIIYQGEVFDIKWSPQSQYLAIHGVGGTVVYDQRFNVVTTMEENTHIEVGDQKFDIPWSKGIAWDPTGHFVVTPFYDPNVSHMELRIWGISDLDVTEVLPFGTNSTSLDWTSNGDFIAVAFKSPLIDEKWAINIWDVKNDFTRISVGNDTIPILVINWHPKEPILAVGYQEGDIELYDIESVDVDNPSFSSQEFDVANGSVNALDWHPDGDLVASSDDNHIVIWNSHSGETLSTYEQDGIVYKLEWNSDGTLLASAGEDAIIRIWDVETGEVITTFEGHEDEIIDLDWSPDDQLIATASLDDTVRIWEVELAMDKE